MNALRLLRQHPTGLTVALAATHAVLALLAAAGRSTFRWPPSHTWIAAAGDHPAWPAMHLAVAVALGVTLTRQSRVRWAARASVGVMVSWSLLSIAWALTVPEPVSLAGGALGLTLAVPVAWWCAETWTHLETPDHNASRETPCGC